jgi:predicted DNA-binding transcriptional regulator YafY
MKRSRSQTERLLDLDQKLRNGNYPNCSSFAAEWEISTKTAQRDLDFLRDRMGAPIQYDAGHRGYTYTESTFMLPALQMNEGELVALLMGSRMLEPFQGTPMADKLNLLFKKLSELMPESITLRQEDLFTQFSVTSPPAMPIAATIWNNVVKALQTGRRLRIEYDGKDGPTAYRVSPVHLANLQGDWYLFVQFDGYENFRQLALSRIQLARVLRSKAEVSGHFNAEKELAETFARFAGQHQAFPVVVVFSAEVAEEVCARQWHPQQKVRRLRDGRLEIRFDAKGDVEVQRWIQAFGQHAEVKSPDWLRERVIQNARELLDNG